MASFGRTNYALLLLAFVTGILTIFNGGYDHFVIYPAGLAVGAGAGAAIVARGYLRRSQPAMPVGGDRLFPRWGWFLAGFTGWAFLGLLWSVDSYVTLLALNELLLGLLIFFLAATSFGGQDAKKLLHMLLIIGTAVALVGLLLFIFVDTGRVRSTFTHPNPFGIYTAMLLLAGAFSYLQNRSRWVALAVVLLGTALVLSGSRGSWLALGAGLVVAGAGLPAQQRWPAARAFLGMGLGIVITVLVITAAAPLVQQEAGTWLEATAVGRWLLGSTIVRPESMVTSSAPGRISFWGVAWRMGLDHPLGGVGLGNYHTAYFLYWPGDRYYSRFAHNYYLQIFAETGWPGLVFLLGFLLSFFWGAWKYRQNNNHLYLGLLGGSLAFLAHSFIDFSWNFPASAVLFWAQAGMLAALQQAGGQEAGAGGRWAVTVTGEAAAACVLPTPGLLAGRGRFGQRLRRWISRGSCPGNRRFPNLFVLALSIWLALSSSLFWLGDVLAGQARQAVARGDLEAGLTRAAQAVRLVPVAAAYRADLAWAYWQAAEAGSPTAYRQRAREELERAVALSPYNYVLNLQLGEILMAGKEFVPAEVFLHRAAVYGGFVPAPYADLGYLYLQQRRYAEAANILRKGLEMAELAEINAPTDAERQRISATKVQMHLNLARAYEELENWPGRQAELNAALEIDPDNPVAGRELDRPK